MAVNLNVLAGAIRSRRIKKRQRTSVEFTFPTLLAAKYDGDSRTNSMGSRSVSAPSVILSGGFGASFNSAGLIQTVCGNKWLLREGYMHAIGASTTLAMEQRSKSLSINTTGNPAFSTTAVAADAIFSRDSDGLASVLTQTDNHVFSASVSVNDGSGTSNTYYDSPNVGSNTLATIARYADALGVAGKVWYVGNEIPRGGTHYAMESRTVTGSTCTATNTTSFVDGESYGAVGVVGVFATGSPRPLTKVASSPGQDQYTVSTSGVYVFGGTAPTTVYITYNATPTSTGLISTGTRTKIVREWMMSTAANYVSTINGVDYGIPGLLYNRPWVRIANTFEATLDSTSGSSQTSLPGMLDNLQLHGTILAAYKHALAHKNVVDTDYPDAVSRDTRPTRNNWYAARGTGTTSQVYSGTLPPSMCTSFTGSAAPTIISVNGVPIGRADTSTGAITGTGIASGSLNFSTGAWTITFTAPATSMPINAQLWFEQDIGNFNPATLTEGTVGRNIVMNGLLDMTAAVGTNITTTTGTSSITTVPSTSIPYGWTLSNTAMQAAITAGTATVSVSSETDSSGFPRFVIEALGTHTAATALQLSSTAFNSISARLTAGDLIIGGAQHMYAKHSTLTRFYGSIGGSGSVVLTTSPGVVRSSSSGDQTCTTFTSRWVDGGTSMFFDDALLNAAGGTFNFYRVTPLLDTTGMTFGSSAFNFVGAQSAANVPFAYRVGVGRVQARRRDDV